MRLVCKPTSSLLRGVCREFVNILHNEGGRANQVPILQFLFADSPLHKSQQIISGYNITYTIFPSIKRSRIIFTRS